MANYQITYTVQLTDVNGNTAVVSFDNGDIGDTTTLATFATGAGAFAAAVAACTNAKVTRIGVDALISKAQISAATSPPPAAATYPSVTDGARLQFANASGFRRSLTIPAPLLSDFKVGQNVVNPTDTNIAALIALVISQGSGPENTNLYEGGAKVGRSLRRRVAHRSL